MPRRPTQVAALLCGTAIACGASAPRSTPPAEAPATPPAAPAEAPTPEPPPVAPLAPPLRWATTLLPIEDVFVIAGMGVVATGKIERGTIAVGDVLELVGLREPRRVEVTGVEMFRKLLERADAGANVGLLLRGVTADEIERGQVLAGVGELVATTSARATLALAATADGGLASPIASGYRPLLSVWSGEATATLTLPGAQATLAPGERADVEVVFERPIPLEPSQVLRVLEAGRTVGRLVIWPEANRSH